MRVIFPGMFGTKVLYTLRTIHSAHSPGIHSMDIIWGHLATKSNVDGSSQFRLLSQVAMLGLTIPHSNTAEEHVFSIVRRNKTHFRPNLDAEGSLGSMVTMKMALSKDIPAYSFEPPKELLVTGKKATKE